MEKKAIDIVLKAGEILRSYWGNLTSIRAKHFYWDLVTEADLASESFIIKSLKEAFPDHSILSEEAGLSDTTSYTHQWIIDPLDGTTNFTHQYPMVAISVALLINQVPVIGIVYNPILNELFIAGKGEGATLNGKAIHVSPIDHLEKSLLGTGFAYDRKETSDNNYAEFCYITNNSQGVRRGGSAAIDLAYVAAGRLDGYWERGLKPWDIAAGILLVEEAGGSCTSYEGDPINLYSGRIIATNGMIHPLLIDELKVAAKKRIL